jgi:hypothetical protein
MNFEDFWIIVIQQNKILSSNSDKITLTRENFRKALKLAFDQGIKTQKELNSDYSKDLFTNLFKGV